jgi:archaellum component FlaC
MSETPDYKTTVNELFTSIKNLVTETEVLIPKIMEGNKSAARNARNNFNGIKKSITPIRQAIQEIIKPSKAK